MIKSSVSVKVFLRSLRCQSGSILVMWAVALPLVIGMLGLGLEVGMWYVAQINLQMATDAAAIAAVHETTSAGRATAVSASLAANGLPGANVTINSPPASGPNTGSINAVEVIANEQRTPLFASLFLNHTVSLSARSVANYVPSNKSSNLCILALDPKADEGVAVLTDSLPSNCGVGANSTNPKAVQIASSSDTVGGLYTMGNYYMGINLVSGDPLYTFFMDNHITTSQTASGKISSSATPVLQATTAVSDPYAALQVPAYTYYTAPTTPSTPSTPAVPAQPACTYSGNVKITTNTTLSAGVYCGNISFTADNVTLTLPGSGNYVIEGIIDSNNTGDSIILGSSAKLSVYNDMNFYDGAGTTTITLGDHASLTVYGQVAYNAGSTIALGNYGSFITYGNLNLNGSTTASTFTGKDYASVITYKDMNISGIGQTFKFGSNSSLTISGALQINSNYLTSFTFGSDSAFTIYGASQSNTQINSYNSFTLGSGSTFTVYSKFNLGEDNSFAATTGVNYYFYGGIDPGGPNNVLGADPGGTVTIGTFNDFTKTPTSIALDGGGSGLILDPGATYLIGGLVELGGGGDTLTLSPGVYTGGILALGGGASITLNPGTYIMDGGDFSVCCNNSANGTGVNFILTSHTGTNYATIGYNQIYSGGNLNISAPTTGPYAGVAIYEDRNAPVGTAAFTGVAQITGSIYAPTANVGVLGNFNGCTSQIIAWAVYWNSSNHTSCTDTTVITSPSNNTISSVE